MKQILCIILSLSGIFFAGSVLAERMSSTLSVSVTILPPPTLPVIDYTCGSIQTINGRQVLVINNSPIQDTGVICVSSDILVEIIDY